MGNKARLILIISMLVFMAARLFHTAQQKSATFDEPGHILAGYHYLIGGDFSANAEHPPLLKLISALPLTFFSLDKRATKPLSDGRLGPLELAQAGVKFLHENGLGYVRTLLAARLPIMALALLGGLAVYFWSKELFGPKAALFSLFLYTFSPEILAHGSLATTDLGAATLVIISAWLFWRLMVKDGYTHLVAGGLAFGMALGSKFTSLALIPVLAIEALAAAMANAQFDSPWLGKKRKMKVKVQISNGLAFKIICFSLSSLITLVAVYKFAQFPVYFEGLKLQWNHAAMGHPAFLMGSISDKGWPYYFLVAFAIKTPLAFLVLLMLSIFPEKRDGPDGRLTYFFLLLPVAAILITSAISRLNMGIRLILPIYPFLFVFAGKTLSHELDGFGRRRIKLAVMVLALWYGVSSLRAHPSYLTYFNEFVGGPEGGSFYLVDSNLDWGQDLLSLKRYIERNEIPHLYLSYFGTDSPKAHGITYQALPPMESAPFILPSGARKDFLAISATYLRGLYLSEPSLYGWLAKMKPVASIGGSIFLFDLKDDPVAHLSLQTVYAASGRCFEAEREIDRLSIRIGEPPWEAYADSLRAWERNCKPQLGPDG